MPDNDRSALLLPLVACLARDLQAAGQLSEPSRKVIWNFIAENRDELARDGAANTGGTQAALRMLEEIAPSADG